MSERVQVSSELRAPVLGLGASIALRGGSAFVLASLLADALRPNQPSLSPLIWLGYVLCGLAATVAVALPCGVIGAVLVAQVSATRWFSRHRERWIDAWTHGLALAALVFFPTLICMQLLMSRRRLPFDFPVEADVGLSWAVAVCAAFIVCITTLMHAQVSRVRASRRPLVSGVLLGFAFACVYLACVPLAVIHAYRVAQIVTFVALSLMLCAAASSIRRVRRSEIVACLALALMGVATPPVLRGVLREALFRRSIAMSSTVNFIARVADFDDDGFLASWANGGDCDDTDASISPFTPDQAGDGVDADCDGQDAKTPISRLSLELRRGAQHPDIWLLSIDALSARHMSVYGYPHRTTPELQRWAQRASVFEHAYSAATSTTFAVPALLSGRYASGLLEGSGHVRGVVVRHSLFDTLGSLGYASKCIVPIEDSLPTAGCRVVEAIAVGPGSMARNSVSLTQLERATSWLEQPSAEPKVLWTHLMDPHAVYIDHGSVGDSPVARYDGEITYVDQLIGEAFARLEASGRLQHTIVILTADHGEQLDGRAVGHGPMVRGDLTHVPLIIWIPNGAGRRVPSPVSALDIYPTLLGLLGARERSGYLEGHSLLPQIMGQKGPAARLVFAEAFDGPFREQAAMDARYLFVLDRATGARRLIDMQRDPYEQHNLVDAEPARATMMSYTIMRTFRSAAVAVAADGGTRGH